MHTCMNERLFINIVYNHFGADSFYLYKIVCNCLISLATKNSVSSFFIKLLFSGRRCLLLDIRPIFVTYQLLSIEPLKLTNHLQVDKLSDGSLNTVREQAETIHYAIKNLHCLGMYQTFI